MSNVDKAIVIISELLQINADYFETIIKIRKDKILL
jgi:hypothetical protein